MAIATTTAATLGAVSAGVGLATTAATTGMSFAQAGKQNRLRRQAEDEAAEAMAAARKKLDVNFYEQLAIQKEPYELEREAMLVQGAEALQAGVEGEQRGAAALAGRVQMAQQKGQRQIAAAMGQELMGLEKLTAAEESRLRDMGVDLDIRAAAGAQLAARDAREAANLATEQGMKGVTNFGRQVAQALPLYFKTEGARITNRIENIGSKKFDLGQTDIQKSVSSLGVVDNVDFSSVGDMSPLEFKNFMGKVNPETLRKIQSQFPNVASSFRPKGYSLPEFNPSQYGYDIPSIGG